MINEVACRDTPCRSDRQNDPALIVTASGLPGGGVYHFQTECSGSSPRW